MITPYNIGIISSFLKGPPIPPSVMLSTSTSIKQMYVPDNREYPLCGHVFITTSDGRVFNASGDANAFPTVNTSSITDADKVLWVTDRYYETTRVFIRKNNGTTVSFFGNNAVEDNNLVPIITSWTNVNKLYLTQRGIDIAVGITDSGNALFAYNPSVFRTESSFPWDDVWDYTKLDSISSILNTLTDITDISCSISGSGNNTIIKIGIVSSGNVYSLFYANENYTYSSYPKTPTLQLETSSRGIVNNGKSVIYADNGKSLDWGGYYICNVIYADGTIYLGSNGSTYLSEISETCTNVDKHLDHSFSTYINATSYNAVFNGNKIVSQRVYPSGSFEPITTYNKVVTDTIIKSSVLLSGTSVMSLIKNSNNVYRLEFIIKESNFYQGYADALKTQMSTWGI